MDILHVQVIGGNRVRYRITGQNLELIIYISLQYNKANLKPLVAPWPFEPSIPDRVPVDRSVTWLSCTLSSPDFPLASNCPVLPIYYFLLFENIRWMYNQSIFDTEKRPYEWYAMIYTRPDCPLRNQSLFSCSTHAIRPEFQQRAWWWVFKDNFK